MPRLVTGDPLRFAQILYNLVGNAVKFTEKGVVTVDLDSSEEDGGAIPVRVVVRDSGIGIEASKLETIFESFTQADAGTSRRFGGTGLGLTISRQLALLLGGDISVESQPGLGTAFTATARFEPCFEVAADAVLPGEVLISADSFAAAAALPQEQGSAGTSSTILLVEDNEMNARVVQRFLRTVGASAVRAGDGLEALRLLRDGNFSMVLMDVEMPGMDGLETSRRIRAGEAGERAVDVRIIAMTAHSEAEARSRCVEAGMDDFVSKPLDFAELDALLPLLTADRRAKPGAALLVSVDPETAPLLDTKQTLIRLGGDEELLRELYGVLLGEAAGRTAEALRSVESHDYEGLRRLAHKVRGSAASIGAERLSAVAASLERAADGHDVDSIDGMMERFLTVYSATVKEISAVMERMRQS